MRLRIFIASLWFVVLIAAVCAARTSVSEGEIRIAIRQLKSETATQSLEILYRDPDQSTKMLITELGLTERGHYVTGKHPQAVWIIRALRSLTGRNFRAHTNAKLTADEAHFLNMNAQGEVEFFGTWMSRDSVWVAPTDAQAAIIKQWHDWFARRGSSYTYVNDRNFDHWYF